MFNATYFISLSYIIRKHNSRFLTLKAVTYLFYLGEWSIID